MAYGRLPQWRRMTPFVQLVLGLGRDWQASRQQVLGFTLGYLMAQVDAAILLLGLSTCILIYVLPLQNFGSFKKQHVSGLSRLNHDNLGIATKMRVMPRSREMRHHDDLLGRYLRCIEECCVHLLKGGDPVIVRVRHDGVDGHGLLPLKISNFELFSDRGRIALKLVGFNQEEALHHGSLLGELANALIVVKLRLRAISKPAAGTGHSVVLNLVSAGQDLLNLHLKHVDRLLHLLDLHLQTWTLNMRLRDNPSKVQCWRRRVLLRGSLHNRKGLVGRLLHNLRNLARVVVRVFFYSLLGVFVVFHEYLKQLLTFLFIFLRFLNISVAFSLGLQRSFQLTLLLELPLQFVPVLLKLAYFFSLLKN